ncbi:hypothetical protein EJ063_17040 [Vibrio aquaticus]|uniref:Anthrax toxin edema factor central domain-containing protein n=1 Tax=Vibrio aquaticus TaxID=2496559 RepID=A0A432CSS9_9VIBR|nr:anthrax toxin-like adenylyl cyclase domain-containing protein [Vibrio aquaticus]RTZ14356.1 hypothetical protein EJ063_17040 [Vibrio aquaticus]
MVKEKVLRLFPFYVLFGFTLAGAYVVYPSSAFSAEELSTELHFTLFRSGMNEEGHSMGCNIRVDIPNSFIIEAQAESDVTAYLSYKESVVIPPEDESSEPTLELLFSSDSISTVLVDTGNEHFPYSGETSVLLNADLHDGATCYFDKVTLLGRDVYLPNRYLTPLETEKSSSIRLNDIENSQLWLGDDEVANALALPIYYKIVSSISGYTDFSDIEDSIRKLGKIYQNEKYLELAENIFNNTELSIDSSGFINEFKHQSSSEINTLLNGLADSSAADVDDFSLNLKYQDKLRRSLLNLLVQDSYSTYASLDFIRSTVLLQLDSNINAHSVNNLSQEDIKELYASLVQDYEAASLEDIVANALVNPEEVAAGYYISINKGSGATEEDFVELMLNGTPLYVDESQYMIKGSTSLIGYNIGHFKDMVFGSTAGGYEERLQLIAIRMLFDELRQDIYYPYGSVENVKATLARRLSTIVDEEIESTISDYEWATLYDQYYLDTLVTNPASVDVLDKATGIISAVRSGLTRRRVMLTVDLTPEQWLALDSPVQLEFTYGVDEHFKLGNSSYQLLPNGSYRYQIYPSTRYKNDVLFCLVSLSFDSGYTYIRSGNDGDAICDGSTDGSGQAVDLPLTRMKHPIYGWLDVAQGGEERPVNIRQLAVELYQNLNNFSSEEALRLFRLNESYVNQTAKVQDASVLLNAEYNEDQQSDEFGLYITRETIARHVMWSIGVPQNLIESRWKDYVNRGSIRNIVIGSSDFEDYYEEEESFWHKQGYSSIPDITNYWELVFESNAKAISQLLAMKHTLYLYETHSMIDFNKAFGSDGTSYSFNLNVIAEAFKKVNGVNIYYDQSHYALFSSDLWSYSPYGYHTFPSNKFELLEHLIDTSRVSVDTDQHSNESLVKAVTMGLRDACLNGFNSPGCYYDGFRIRGIYNSSATNTYRGLMLLYKDYLFDQKEIFKSIESRREKARRFSKSIGKAILPLWGTIDDFKMGNNSAGVAGVVGDIMTFVPIFKASASAAVGRDVTLSLTLKALKNSSKSFARGIGAIFRKGKVPVLGTISLDRKRLYSRLKDVFVATLKQSYKEIVPINDVYDLLNGGRRKLKKFKLKWKANRLNAKGTLVNAVDDDFVKLSSKRPQYSCSLGGSALSGCGFRYGMPAEHRTILGNIANEKDIAIGVRPVDPLAESLIESGEFVTKNFEVKAKTSDWGPMMGFIPVDQSFSKASIRTSPERVSKFSKYSQDVIDRGLVSSVPLKISSARIDELVGAGKIQVDSVLANGSLLLTERNNTVFRLDFSGADNKYTVKYFNEQGAFQPLNVLALASNGKLMIADYDLLAVVSHYSNLSEDSYSPVRISWSEYKVRIEEDLARSGRSLDDLTPDLRAMYDDHNFFVQWESRANFPIDEDFVNIIKDSESWEGMRTILDDLFDNVNEMPPILKQAYDSQKYYSGLRFEYQFGKGNISPELRVLIGDINTRFKLDADSKLIHHNHDASNSFSALEDNFPALFFVPDSLEQQLDGVGLRRLADGSVHILDSDEMLKLYQVLLDQKYVPPQNYNWLKSKGVSRLRGKWFTDTQKWLDDWLAKRVVE